MLTLLKILTYHTIRVSKIHVAAESTLPNRSHYQTRKGPALIWLFAMVRVDFIIICICNIVAGEYDIGFISFSNHYKNVAK